MEQSSIIQNESTLHVRKVWVINTYQVPPGQDPSKYTYKEDFRGSGKIEIPANGVKKVLMPHLQAERFLGVAVAPHQPNPDGTIIDYETGEPDMTRFGKPLKIVELTLEEKQEFDPESLNEKEKLKLEEKALSAKSHVPDDYAGAEPAATVMGRTKARTSKGQAAKDLSESLE